MILVTLSPIDLQEVYPVYSALKRLDYPIMLMGLKPFRNGVSYITDNHETYELKIDDYVKIHHQKKLGTYALYFKGADALPLDRFVRHIDYYERKYDAETEEPFWEYWQRWMDHRGDI